jgi:hypothetical protein
LIHRRVRAFRPAFGRVAFGGHLSRPGHHAE